MERRKGDRIPFPEGVYLKGQGVVYQVTLPPPPVNPVEEQAEKSAPALTPWERARGEVRGGKRVPPPSREVQPPAVV